ncbi:hypothetical protein FRC08_009848 [Ceratobasidium sp. 394]|nr:hypothetical protein FRC08_009848 [Ceratobasidium sp. 394]
MPLPTELWFIVISNLTDDHTSLARLCRVNTQLYAMLLSTVYQKVTLSTSLSISSFCRGVTTRPMKLAGLVQTLNIGSSSKTRLFTKDDLGLDHFPDSPLHNGLAKPFRASLQLLLNLQELALTATSATLDICFHNLSPPFKLRTLAVPHILSGQIQDFLRNQPSIEVLHVLSTSLKTETVHSYDFIRNHPDVLARLRCATASALCLDALSSGGRQLSQVVVTTRPGVLSVLPPNHFGALYQFPSLFSEPTITCVGWSRSRQSDPWYSMVGRLKTHPSHKFVEKLIVMDVDKAPQSYWATILPRQLAFISRDNAFGRLKCIEMAAMFDSYGSESEVLACLGDMSNLNEWVKYVTTLQSVSVYGVQLT